MTNRYDALRYIFTVTNGSAAFDTLQAPIPHIIVYYICIHKLITFVTLLQGTSFFPLYVCMIPVLSSSLSIPITHHGIAPI